MSIRFADENPFINVNPEATMFRDLKARYGEGFDVEGSLMRDVLTLNNGGSRHRLWYLVGICAYIIGRAGIDEFDGNYREEVRFLSGIVAIPADKDTLERAIRAIIEGEDPGDQQATHGS